MRYSIACTPLSAVPNGCRPVAAYARTEPRQKTSQAGVSASPRTCSGAMKPGEPTAAPVRVRPLPVTASSALAMPKSMTRGPSMVSSTLDGLRSRWMIPAAWIAWSARASPAARIRTVRSGSGAALAGDDLLERGARDVAGGDPGGRGLGVRVQHRRGPLAADPQCGPHLLPEARAELLLVGEFGAHQLDRDGAPAVRTGQEDLPHAAFPEPPDQAVVPDALRITLPQRGEPPGPPRPSLLPSTSRLLHDAPPFPRNPPAGE